MRFTKLQEVDLTLEDPVIESSSQNGESGIEIERLGTQDEGTVQLNLDSDKKDPITFIHKWKFWKKPYRYNVTSSSARSTRRKCPCKINSWRAVIITLLAFTAAVLISVVISRLASEPPDETPIPGPNGKKYQGESIVQMALKKLKLELVLFSQVLISYFQSLFQNIHSGAVAADVPVCSEMSAGILKRNGSAVDAAITALLCLGQCLWL